METYSVLSELSLKDEAIKAYIDFICTKVIARPGVSSYSDGEQFATDHQALNESVVEVF